MFEHSVSCHLLIAVSSHMSVIFQCRYTSVLTNYVQNSFTRNAKENQHLTQRFLNICDCVTKSNGKFILNTIMNYNHK